MLPQTKYIGETFFEEFKKVCTNIKTSYTIDTKGNTYALSRAQERWNGIHLYDQLLQTWNPEGAFIIIQ